MEKLKHLYVVPTNRYIKDDLFNYNEEIKWIENSYNIKIEPMVFDDSKDDLIAEYNREKCQKYGWIFLDIDEQNRIIKEIIGKIQNDKVIGQKLYSLFFGDQLSYGKVANRIFVIANYLGYDVIHRRDSDTSLYNKNEKYPLELEIKILRNEKYPFVVGGGYIGDWAIAYNDVNNDIFHKIIFNGYKYSNMKHVANNINFRFSEQAKNISKEYCNVNQLMVELGNCMMTDIYKILPCNPANFTNGVDYIYHWIVNSMGIGQYYHNYKVMHNHPNSDHDYFYHYGFAKSRATNVYFYDLYIRIEKEIKKEKNINRIREIITSLNKFDMESLEIKSREVLMEHIALLKTEEKYKCVAKKLESDSEKIINEVKEDIKNYVFLNEYWQKMFEK